MRLSVVIITWNGLAYLKACLESLVPTFDFDCDEIVVVDNASSDGTVPWLKDTYPQIRLLQNDQNMGVAPARNKGMWYSKGDYIMILDNDTRYLSQKNLGEVISGYFKDHEDVGLFAFRLRNPDGTLQDNVRRFPDVFQPFVARLGFLRKIGFLDKSYHAHLMHDVALEEVTSSLDVDYVLGANQVFRREIAVHLKGYDDFIFYGPEDCDFCLRVHRLGYKVQYVPAVEICHEYQRNTRGFGMRTLKHAFYFYYFFFKNRAFFKIKI
ncbi:glycosyltransferase family 2 protein [Terasakiella pusilla]|uniref:glycosyltransferase family 2 protein n=1 Tax=Terasakiella pusilla TaxID=64973 RepID=UPI003AA91F46